VTTLGVPFDSVIRSHANPLWQRTVLSLRFSECALGAETFLCRLKEIERKTGRVRSCNKKFVDCKGNSTATNHSSFAREKAFSVIALKSHVSTKSKRKSSSLRTKERHVFAKTISTKKANCAERVAKAVASQISTNIVHSVLLAHRYSSEQMKLSLKKHTMIIINCKLMYRLQQDEQHNDDQQTALLVASIVLVMCGKR
jgi:hypothetical protein